MVSTPLLPSFSLLLPLSFYGLTKETQRSFFHSIFLCRQRNIEDFFLSLWTHLHQRHHGAFLLKGPKAWGKKELWSFLVTLLILKIPPEKAVLSFFKRYGSIVLEKFNFFFTDSLLASPSDSLYRDAFQDFLKSLNSLESLEISLHPRVSLGEFFRIYEKILHQEHPQLLYLQGGSSKEDMVKMQEKLSFCQEDNTYVLCSHLENYSPSGYTRFLNLLEQPWDKRIFLLTTYKNIPSTLSSRCFIETVPLWEAWGEKGILPLMFLMNARVRGLFDDRNSHNKKDSEKSYKKSALKNSLTESKNDHCFSQYFSSFFSHEVWRKSSEAQKIFSFLGEGSLGLLEEYIEKWPFVEKLFFFCQQKTGFCFLPLSFFSSEVLTTIPQHYTHQDFFQEAQLHKELFLKILWFFLYALEDYFYPLLEKQSPHDRQYFLCFLDGQRHALQELFYKEKTYGLSSHLTFTCILELLENLCHRIRYLDAQ